LPVFPLRPQPRRIEMGALNGSPPIAEYGKQTALFNCRTLMPDSQVLIPATLASALIFGMVPALLAGVRVHWARQLGIEEKRAGALAAALHLTLVPMMLGGGVALDKWGAAQGLVAGSVLLALGLAALAVSRSLAQALAPIFLIGGAGACLGIGSFILMPRAF